VNIGLLALTCIKYFLLSILCNLFWSFQFVPLPVFDTGIHPKLTLPRVRGRNQRYPAKVKANESTILLGDLIAHVRNDAWVWKVVIGQHSDADIYSLITEGSCFNCAVTTYCASETLSSDTKMCTSTPGEEIRWVNSHSLISAYFLPTYSQCWTFM